MMAKVIYSVARYAGFHETMTDHLVNGKWANKETGCTITLCPSSQKVLDSNLEQTKLKANVFIISLEHVEEFK